MSTWYQKIWQEVARPVLRRPPRVQFAAICTRDTPNGPEVLLITSRDTGRWVIPKGWPINGKDGAETAQHEAWEEAGVQPDHLDRTSIGHFSYDKVMDDGSSIPVHTNVYRIRVKGLAENYPEAGQRDRRWFPPQKAAELVREPELSALLRQL